MRFAVVLVCIFNLIFLPGCGGIPVQDRPAYQFGEVSGYTAYEGTKASPVHHVFHGKCVIQDQEVHFVKTGILASNSLSYPSAEIKSIDWVGNPVVGGGQKGPLKWSWALVPAGVLCLAVIGAFTWFLVEASHPK